MDRRPYGAGEIDMVVELVEVRVFGALFDLEEPVHELTTISGGCEGLCHVIGHLLYRPKLVDANYMNCSMVW